MKKIIVILVSVFFIFSFNSFAEEMTYLKSFYVGQFDLNHANWNAQMEAQLLEGLSGLQSAEFKVFGHTDETGPVDFNKELSLKRSALVANKITKLFPESQVEILGKTYAPLEGQMVNYRMVLVEVYAESQLVLLDIKEAISALGVIVGRIESKSTQMNEVKVIEQKIDLSKVEEKLAMLSRSIDELKSNQVSFSQISQGDGDLNLLLIEKSFSGLQERLELAQSENRKMLEQFRLELEKTNTNVLALSEKVDKLASWNIVFWVLPFLALLIIILVLLLKKPKKEDNSEWVGISIQREDAEKKFSVQCEKGEGFYTSPIRNIKHDSLSDLKKSLRSDLNNFLKEDKSESFVSAGLEEKIKKLISSGFIKES